MSLKDLRCPGCYGKAYDHLQDGCAVAMVANVIRDRRGFGRRKLAALINEMDADFLWSLIGPTVDAIEERHFPS